MHKICNMHSICRKYGKYDINMQEICKTYARHMQDICKTYAENMLNMHEICMQYAWNMLEICMQYAWNMQRNMQEIWQIWHKYVDKYASNMQ